MAQSAVSSPQARPPSTKPAAAVHLTSSTAEILAVPVYRFELQQHSNWLMARFRYMWRMKLLCNAAIGNGSSNIMVRQNRCLLLSRKKIKIDLTLWKCTVMKKFKVFSGCFYS